MGFLDGILGDSLGGLLGGSAAGQQQNQASPLVAIALQLMQNNGGLSGILDRFRQAGLGQHADSWVSTGQNMPVSGGQVSQALGPDLINQLAAKAGLDPNQVSHGLSEILPNLINQMTPNGQVPEDHHNMIADGLRSLL